MTTAAPGRQAGLTLIEVMIAVALFALIGMAGFALVQSIISIQQRTDHRLDNLSDLQRTMHILTSDFEQAEPGTLMLDGDKVSFHRAPDDPAGAALVIGYSLEDNILHRSIIGPDGQPRMQALIGDVETIKWRFLTASRGWFEGLATSAGDDAKPIAIALDISLSADRGDGGGHIRRVVALPRAPRL
jgi:general secretion pathway protein J